MNMNAVGIDVSKRKSTVAILRPGGRIVVKPFDVPHLSTDFQSLKELIRKLDGETRIVMECTGRYYEPVARKLSQDGFFVSAVNPQIIRNFQGQGNPLRKVKTDKADSVKIARYTLFSNYDLFQQIFFKSFMIIPVNILKKQNQPDNIGKNRHIRCYKIRQYCPDQHYGRPGETLVSDIA